MNHFKLDRRQFAGFLGATAAGALLPGIAHAADPMRMIVGFPAGGFVDGVARALAEEMKGPIADSIIVDNRTGAGGRLAARAVADAGDAGRTLLVTPAAMITIYPSSYKQLEYDPGKDLAPVGRAAKFMLAVVVGKNHPANTLDELKAWFKVNEAKAAFGTPGAGTGAHLAAVELTRSFGVEKIPFVHYRGDPPQLVDIIGGALQVGISTIGAVERVRDKLKVIAVTGAERHPGFPDTPTLKEKGVDLVVEEWVGVFAPRGTPPARLAELNGALNKALESASVKNVFNTLGVTPAPTSPTEFGQIIAADTSRWGKIIKAIGFSAD